jgi:hypothetical protein
LHKFTKRKKKREKKGTRLRGWFTRREGKFGAHEKNTQGEVVNSLNGAR